MNTLLKTWLRVQIKEWCLLPFTMFCFRTAKLLLFLGVLLLPFTITAQVFPVTATPQVIPPHSLRLSEYTTSISEKLILNLLLTDVNEFNFQVGLKLYIESNSGVAIQSSEIVIGANPIFLDGGTPLRLSNLDLRPYFELQNLQGVTPQQYSSTLPEGLYRFCFEVYDVIKGKRISRKSCATVYLVLNDPPFLNIPNKGEQILVRDPQNIIFQWTPRHLNATNVSYEFTLAELWDTQMDPQAAFLASRPLYQTTTFATTLLYGPAETPLLPDKNYAWRVRAIVSDGISESSVFKNNGYSEIYHFTYTGICPEPQYVLAEGQNPTKEKILWQGLDHTGYNVQYRKKGVENSRWFEEETQNPYVLINSLAPGTTYEFRVGGRCMDKGGFTYSQIYEFTTLIGSHESATYNCGITPEIVITNQEPLQDLLNGDVFTAGDFPITIMELAPYGSPQDGVYSGWGYIVVPYLLDTRLKVIFDTVTINTDYQLIQGTVYTDYDPAWSGMDDISDELDILQDLLGTLTNLFKEQQELLDAYKDEQDPLVRDSILTNYNTSVLETDNRLNELLQSEYITEEEKKELQDVKDIDKIASSDLSDKEVDSYKELNAEKGDKVKEIARRVAERREESEAEISTTSFDFEIPQSLDNIYKEEKLSLDVKPSSSSFQVFDYEGILSSEFENYFKNLSIGGKYKVRVYTYNSQSELLKAIESIVPKQDEVVLFIQKKEGKALIKISLGLKVSEDLLKKGITKEDLFATIKEASPTELKESVVFKEIKNNLFAYTLVKEAEAYDGNIAALIAIKLLDWGISGIENFKLSEEYYNPNSNDYTPLFGSNQIENAFVCGVFNGLINEAKSIPDLASMLIKVSSSEENQKRLKQDIDKLLEAGVLNTLVQGFVQRYTGKSDAIIAYNTGKDVVAVATIFISFTTITKAGKVTSIVKLVNPLQGALDLFKLASRTGLSVQRSGKNIILYIGNNINKVVAKIDSNNLFRQIKWTDNGTVLETVENIRYIDKAGKENIGSLNIVRNGDEVGININNAGGGLLKSLDDYPDLVKRLDDIGGTAKTKFLDDFADVSDNIIERLGRYPESVNIWSNHTSQGQKLLRENVDTWLKYIEARPLFKAKDYDGVIKLFGGTKGQSFSHKGYNYVVDGIPDTKALDEAILISNMTEDVSLIAKNLNVPESVISKVKDHYFVKQHLMNTDEGLKVGRFERIMEDIDEWKNAIKGFDNIDARDGFKRLIAHEYIELKLMENGVSFRSIDELYSLNPSNLGAHDIAPLIRKNDYASSLERLKNPPVPNSELSNLDEIVNDLLKTYGIK